VPARTRQFYFSDTNLLITRFSAPSGVGQVEDFMPLAADRSNAQPHQLIHRSGTAARSPARCPANYVRHRRQAFVQYEGGDVVDAAVLIMPLVKFISLVAPQWLTTLDAVGANLVSDT